MSAAQPAAGTVSAATPGVGTIVAAALLPPLGVYNKSGGGRDFVVACVLTALGFLPGVAFALHRVLLDRG